MPEILERVADIGYKGVEFVDRANHDMEFDAVADALDDTGLEPLGAHVWLHQIEDELPALAERYGALGCDTFVVPYHPETNFRTEKRMKRLAERLNRVGERARDWGFDLLFHPNHWSLIPLFDGPVLGQVPSLRATSRVDSVSQDLRVNSAPELGGYGPFVVNQMRRVENESLRRRNSVFDRVFMASGLVTDNDVRTLVEETPLGYLLARTDPASVGFQLDVSFLVQQGYDPAEVILHLSDRVKSVHAKDVRTEEYTPGGWPSFVDPGEGRVDFEGVVKAAQQGEIEWVIFENGHADDPLRSIRMGMDILQSAGLRPADSKA
jgi:sugar phosphate isomerase/epimerase